MNIVITMAGIGSRFKKAGYEEPKFMIKAKGKTLFEWSMDSLIAFNNGNCKYIFIVREQDNAKQFIKENMKKYNISNINIIEIKELTDGQATTAMLAKKYWNEEEALIIYNIDTYIEANQMNLKQIHGDGFIPCFNGEGEHWSFVKLDDNGKAVEVREKERISNNCTIGLYYFRNCKLYEKLYNEYYINNNGQANGKNQYEQKEKYIAPLYNYLIKRGGEVYISTIPTTKVHVLGTPEELEEFKEINLY